MTPNIEGYRLIIDRELVLLFVVLQTLPYSDRACLRKSLYKKIIFMHQLVCCWSFDYAFFD